MSAITPISRWLPWSAAEVEPDKLRVICLPHAGGSASSFRPWIRRHASARLAICPVEYPGRGIRLEEPLAVSVEAMAAGLASDLRDWLSAGPFAIIGHSLGALVGFSLVQRLEAAGGCVPVRLVLCGARPPCHGKISPWHLLSRSGLIERLRTLGGLADRILDNDEVLDVILPLIQADLSIAENWQLADGHAAVAVPVAAVAAQQDTLAPPEAVAAWRDFATGPFGFHILPGDHFFPHVQSDELVALARSSSPRWPEATRLVDAIGAG
jgi:medium-chain acyl-[acyl-carrier-protein] hydrolase